MKLAHNRRDTPLDLIQWLARVIALLLKRPAALSPIAFFWALTSSAQTSVPGQLADQYVRTDFTVEDGLPDNVVDAVVQTRNGLLWVGTQAGLARFNGRGFTAIDLTGGGPIPQGSVHTLIESSHGDLWAGTDAGVVLIPRTALDRFDPALLTFYHLGSASVQVDTLLETKRGEIWAGTMKGLYHFDGRKFVQVISDDGVSRISEALNGNLLLIGGQEFFEWDGHQVIRHPGLAASLGLEDKDIFHVFQDRDGTIWYGTERGLMRRGKVAQPPLQPSNVAKTGVFRVSQDRDGAIWFTSRLGVYRVNGNQLESPAPGLGTRAFYLDRDGDLWIGTNGYGLVHFRRRIVRMFTTADGLPVDSVMAILPSHDGKLWLGGNCGFSEYDGEHFRIYQEKDGLLNTCVWSLAEDPNHDLWIGTYGGGMFRMHDGQFTQYSKEQGLADRIVLQIAVAQDGSLWVATQEGLSHMQSGHFRNYTTADGLASNLILGVHQDRAGTVWAATQAGVNRLVGDRFVPFPSSPSEGEAFAIRFAEDTRGDLFTLESPRGLSLVANDRLVKVPEDFKFLGMVESPEHDLWFSGKNGITRVRRDDLINAAWSQQGPLDYQTFNRSDGLASIQCSNGRPNIALTADRKLWVATVKGLATINLAQIPRDATPPKLFVGSITVGREKVQAGEDLTLPPGTHHLELHLEAVDLSSPEKVRIQYRMDDVDPLWLDADMSHTAVYSNLPPGKHALHVRASASNGVWDRGGIVFDVTQEPYFYQTTWFRLLTAAIFILLASTVYLLRVRQILRLAKVRMAERIEERTRIARDLHDTLLQSFQAVLLRLQSVRNVLPDRPGEAAQRLDSAMDQTAQAIAEGRDAVRELRSSTAVGNDLAQAIGKLGEEFRANESNRSSAAFVMQVEGAPRDLSPILRDEVYRIAGEAMRNAFRHADAHRIEVEIRYDDRQFRLRVRDDGKGIDPHLLAQSEPAGHYGLHGMRERATLVGGHLDVWSKLTSGTEVELTIPALIAYVPNPDHQHSGPSSAETDS